MKKCPCKDCDHRTLTCHGFCKGYQAWKEELRQTKKWLRGYDRVITEGSKNLITKLMRQEIR